MKQIKTETYLHHEDVIFKLCSSDDLFYYGFDILTDEFVKVNRYHPIKEVDKSLLKLLCKGYNHIIISHKLIDGTLKDKAAYIGLSDRTYGARIRELKLSKINNKNK